MLLYELLSGIECRYFGADPKWEITRPFSDSRNAVFGGIFVCVDGTKTSGESFVADAMEKGCLAVVAKRRIDNVPTVVTEDTRYALSVIWNNYYKRPSLGMRLFGITGTNGKTSTAQFLFSCLRADKRRVGIIGTLGSFAMDEKIEIGESELAGAAVAMTTPDPEYLYGTFYEFKKRGITDVVMEVSSHAVSQRKVDALSFEFGLFTNLSREHLDYHEDMESYFKVKASFCARCEKRVVNTDDPYGARFAESIPAAGISLSQLDDVRVGTGTVSYTVDGQQISAQVGGKFTIYNTLLAYRAAILSGVKRETAAQGIAVVMNIRGRLERVAKKETEGFDVIIDYAHTPTALEGVLRHLRSISEGRLICVFGCGGDRDKTKRPMMGRIAQMYSDAVIVTEDNSRCEDPLSIFRDIISGMTGTNSVVIPDRREAIFAAIAMADKGDTVVLCGKGHENYEIKWDRKTYFDEREVVKEGIRLKHGK